MNTSERLAKYETALEAIGILISHRSARIAQEKQKPVPDLLAIDGWMQEMRSLRAEERALRYEDEPAQDRIIGNYVKAGSEPC